MNIFVYWKNENGEVELITPPLDGTILPGVTRSSIIDLAKSLGEFKSLNSHVMPIKPNRRWNSLLLIHT